ncbi:MAG: signal peptidase II [Rhodothermales bacterium]
MSDSPQGSDSESDEDVTPVVETQGGLREYRVIALIALVIVIIDQVCKITVVKTMYQGQSIPVLGDWLRLTYTENAGMAFGIELGAPALVTIFSIVATVLIVMYLAKVGRLFAPYRYSLALVLGGAFGNIIDRVLYGKIIYDEPLFLGRVVDFIHVNMWRGHIPDGIPFIGGNYVALFPIWNVADMAIVAGVVGILVFQRSFHKTLEEKALEAAGLPVQPEGEGDDPRQELTDSPV